MFRTIFLGFITLCASSATAQAPPTKLEYPEGPVVGSNRVIALGGAYTGIAEGADGHMYNPAAFATRYRFTTDQDLDWDWTLYSLNVPESQNPDLYGPAGSANGASYLGGAIDMKIHAFGFGVHSYIQDYRLEVSSDEINGGDSDQLIVSNALGGFGFAFLVSNLDILVGAFIYGFTWSVQDAIPLDDGTFDEGPEAISLAGVGGRLGVLWQPERRPVRVGVAFRPPLTTSLREANDPDFFDSVPSVYQPAQLTVGASYMLWERQYNPYTTYGLKRFERLRPEQSDRGGRRYVLLSYDTVVTGTSDPGTVSMRGFFRGTRIPAGKTATVGFRAGVESELIANWLVLRGGGYSEPARTDAIKTRVHGTGGLAVRIPIGGVVPFWPWDLRVDGSFDLARDFRNFGFGLGFWH